jgi:hypothetical protein
MSIHRGIAVAAALTLALMTASCSSDDDPGPTPAATTPTTATPTPGPTADPAGKAVPLDGEKDAPIEWTVGGGVDAKDPVVEVARRLQSLWVLAPLSAEWSDEAKIKSAADALTDGKVLKDFRLDEWTDRDKAGGKAPVRLLVQAPEVDGEKAVVWTCLDPNAAFGIEKTSGSALVEIKLAVIDGAWKVTSYDQNTPGVPDRVQICQDF